MPSRRLQPLALPSILMGLLALLCFVPASLPAQVGDPAASVPELHPPFPEGVTYDPAVPTPEEVLGHHPGQAITPPEEIVRYFRALADAVPARTHLVEYGTSWEGRPLVTLVIAHPARIEDMERVRQGLARLADPRDLDDADSPALIEELPVVTALVHSVHGNEITPAGAAMATAYHLLAARDDPEVDLILQESVVLLDPIQNPDGRARFIAQNLLGAAMDPDPDPVAAERDEPWPGGRSNHYLFDLNRDWFAHTQPESRGRVRALLQWHPHVVVDLHEMGGNNYFYFPPAAVPGNPHTTAGQHELFRLFGERNAELFDDRGWPYFIREIYDSFYPGYGASWPTAHGALGKTFEQGSPRGLFFRRYDGTTVTYADGVEHNFQISLRTLRTAAENREAILGTFLDFRRTAARGWEDAPGAYVLVPGRDPALASRLARLLAANGIEVRRADEGFQTGGRDFEAGSYVVPVGQPAGRLVRNLLDPQTEMDPGFIELQRERRARRLPDQIYDVTAWNLPHLWNVEAVAVAGVPTPSGDRVMPDEPETPGSSTVPPARAGHLIPWSTAGARTVALALGEDIPLRAAGAPLVLDGRRFGIGTVLARGAELTPEQVERLGEIAAAEGAELVPADHGFVEEGISLGSNRMRALPGGRVLLVWDTPASSLSAGWARWVLERRYGQRVTAVRTGSLGRADLSEFGVVVVPSGNYAGALGPGQVDRLREWIRSGGTLITMGESTRWAARDDVGLLPTVVELRAGSGEGEAGNPPAADGQPMDYLEAIAPPRETPEPVPGAILRVAMDTSHVLSAGTGGELGAQVSGSRIFRPLTLDQGTNVGIYGEEDDLVLSGIVWPEGRPQLASKAFLMEAPMGRGKVIAFAEDPNFRGYAEGTQLLFMNAVLLGPAF